MKNKLTINDILNHEPCSNGANFLKQSKTLQRAWESCPRADWMIWALNVLNMLDDATARAFACDCAEHTLHFFEEKYPYDKRPRLAIDASRRTITDQSETAIAARYTARDAAEDAAEDAAYNARDVAEYAAWATRDAAWAARYTARDAAWATGAAENKWQADHLRTLINPFKG